jgi:hypoxanthine phosphoribosyltransferase
MSDQLISIEDLRFKPYISAEEIQKKIDEMARQIREEFEGKKPVFLAVLNGAFVFAADLTRAVNIQSEITFIKLASYKGMKSSGKVETLIGLDTDLEDRHIIIVEDIVDSGKTLSEFIPELHKFRPKSVSIAALLLKPEELRYPIDIKFLGFEIPPKFVVGYGLDYDGLGRELSAIYQLEE